MRVFASLLSCCLLLCSTAEHLKAQPASETVPMCEVSQLSFATDAENGNFDGMSHSGTLLVLRNLGPNACKLEAFPPIIFSDIHGPKIALTAPGGKFMHPGPVMLPAIVAAGAEATSSLRWVSGAVYDPGVCFQVTSVAAQVNHAEVKTALTASICGVNASSVSVERSRFALDPVYKRGVPK